MSADDEKPLTDAEIDKIDAWMDIATSSMPDSNMTEQQSRMLYLGVPFTKENAK